MSALRTACCRTPGKSDITTTPVRLLRQRARWSSAFDSVAASGDTEEIDVSPAEFMATFKEAMDEMLGGLSVQARSHNRKPSALRSSVADTMLGL